MAKSTILRLVHDAAGDSPVASAGAAPSAGVAVAADPTGESPSTRVLAPTAFGLHAGLSDAQVVAVVLGGDVTGFESLYRRHAGFAINLAVRLQGNASDAEDVVHDAFIRAYNHLSELRDRDAFKAWLGSIVVRLVRTRLRSERLARWLGFGARREAPDLEALASHEASPEARAELAQVYALLTLLPTDCRLAWALRFIEGHRLEVVAALSQCSLATAKRRILRAQQFLDLHFVNPVLEASQ